MSGNEAADQVVSMSLRGIEVMAKISGEGAKHLAVYLFAVLQGQKQTRGRTRLENLLRSGKELKVFAVRNEDLPTFCKEAKRYGVLYCALRDKKNVDGLCDVMVRAEDASKINRIVERFQLATADTASIKQEIEQARQEKQPDLEAERAMEVVENPEATVAETAAPETEISEDFLDELLGKKPEPPGEVELGNEVLEGGSPIPQEPLAEAGELEHPHPIPPHQAENLNQSEPLSPSAPTSAHSEASETISEPPKQKVSVRQLLREIREENRAAEKRRQQQQEREPGLPKRKDRGKTPVAVNAPVETPKRSKRKRGKAK
ncbi:hypothetical protein SK3146_05721 [Paenibacillus konkukensis]|uniref:DUF3801 domain-containing protein n=1 Tax=Paenibacillus konkukensis TaxID=2020716 RepID=A0ABY4RY14_9BACL|nr:PcfB family protein [Paenibacillus konkukensis]UQZ86428.1 hypothetical protein SK3146_05721 [Paenibacillus konkukensis]